jgi:hypothetical protein
MQKQFLLLSTALNLACGARPRLLRIDHDDATTKARLEEALFKEEEEFLFAQDLSFSMSNRRLESTETSSSTSPDKDTRRKLERDGKARLEEALFKEEEELLFAQDLSFSMPNRRLESTETSASISPGKDTRRKLKRDGKARLEETLFKEEEELLFAQDLSFSLPNRRLGSTETFSSTSPGKDMRRKLKRDGKARLEETLFKEEEESLFAQDLSFSMSNRRLAPGPALPIADTQPRFLRTSLDTDDHVGTTARQRKHRSVSSPESNSSTSPDKNKPRRLRTRSNEGHQSLVDNKNEVEFGRA